MRVSRLAIAASAVIAIAAGIQLVTVPPVAATAQPMSRGEIEEIVRAYLLENPEIIFEAAEVYAERQRALAAAATEETARTVLPTLLSGETGHVAPAPSGDANVVVVEFFDYNCGFCRRATDYVLALQQNHPDTTLVFQELPVTHPASREPALIALSAANTDEYLALHRELMTADGLVDEDRARSVAQEVGLTAARIDETLGDTRRNARLSAMLDQSLALAEELGLDGTPAFLVASADGSFIDFIPGFDPDAVDSAIAAAARR